MCKHSGRQEFDENKGLEEAMMAETERVTEGMIEDEARKSRKSQNMQNCVSHTKNGNRSQI